MNRNAEFVISAVAGAAWTRLLAAINMPIEAFACCRAAQCDEKNGFEFTAAMEWRKAAQHLAGISTASEFCWKRWERIMHLPRRLANPLVDDTAVQFTLNMNSVSEDANLGEIPATQIPVVSVA
jgi:hypothetical protein